MLNSTELNQRLSRLMQQSQEGDAQAYHGLLSELSKILDRFLAKRIDRNEARDELSQEILISIHTSRHTYDPTQPLLPWVYAISRHRLMDYWRKNGQSSQTIPLEESRSETWAAPEPREALLTELGITEHLLELPEKQRRSIELVKQEGLSIAEAAKEMSVSESVVKVSIHRAIRALRKKLGKEDTSYENSRPDF